MDYNTYKLAGPITPFKVTKDGDVVLLPDNTDALVKALEDRGFQVVDCRVDVSELISAHKSSFSENTKSLLSVASKPSFM